MKQHWTKFSAGLLLAATAASAQTAGGLSAIFDGQAGLSGISRESLIPVVRETKPAEPRRMPTVRAEEAPAAPAAAELVPVALEFEVPAEIPQTQAVADHVARLRSTHQFFADPGFDPVRLAKFHILPFPPVTRPLASYLVRGVVPAPRVEVLRQDASVRNVYRDRATDPKALEELVLRHGKQLRRERGVRDVYVGFDCGVEGPHQHIAPHYPAIVVVTDGSIGLKSVRVSIFQSLPALAIEPVVFVQK
ncbi:MAG: hypothetical protein HY553_22715 [Elusimicrobia bacterium]|nr:hypothetical protein [Elusimicrobiota bacterium]